MLKSFSAMVVFVLLTSVCAAESPFPPEQEQAIHDIQNGNGHVFIFGPNGLPEGLRRDQRLDQLGRNAAVMKVMASASDSVLKRLSIFPRLQEVELRSVSPTDNWDELAKCRELRSINITNLSSRQEQAFEAIGQLPELEKLYFRDCDIPASCYRHLTGLKKLKIFWVSSAKEPINDEAIEHIGQITSLTDLSVSLKDVTSLGMPHLGRLTNLDRLSLAAPLIQDDDLRHLSKMTKIKWLYFSASSLTGKGLAHLSDWEQLSVVTFYSGPKLNDDLWPSAATLKRLHKLEISGPTPQITGRGIESLDQHPELGVLEIHGSNFTDEAFARFPNLPKLHWLEITGSPHLTGTTLSALGDAPRLTIVNLSNNGLTDEGLSSLAKANLPQLGLLQLNHTKITDNGLTALAQIKTQRDLQVQIQDCEVSGSTLGDLAKSPIMWLTLPKTMKHTVPGVQRFLEAPDKRVVINNETYNHKGLMLRKPSDPKSGK